MVASDVFESERGRLTTIEGREAVAGFFNGSAHAALPALVDGRPGAAWFNRGQAMVAFDFTIADGVVTAIVFRADPEVLAAIVRRPVVRDTPGATSE